MMILISSKILTDRYIRNDICYDVQLELFDIVFFLVFLSNDSCMVILAKRRGRIRRVGDQFKTSCHSNISTTDTHLSTNNQSTSTILIFMIKESYYSYTSLLHVVSIIICAASLIDKYALKM